MALAMCWCRLLSANLSRLFAQGRGVLAVGRGSCAERSDRSMTSHSKDCILESSLP